MNASLSKKLNCLVFAALAASSLTLLSGCLAATGANRDPSGNETSSTERREALTAMSRTSYVVAELNAFNAGLSAADRAEKYAAMKASPFSFFRGSNHLYWKDLGDSPELFAYGGVSQTRAWIGGDMHVNNTGSFDDDQGVVVFGINDFDEALIADYQLDVWRAAASLALIARENGVFSAADEASFLDAFSESYLDAMASYAGNSGETTKKFTAGNTYGLLDDFLADVTASNSRVKMLDAWTVKVGGVRKLNTSTNPDLAAVSAAEDTDIKAHMDAYRTTLSGGALPASYFKVKSVAKRLHAGVGSIGAARYYVLIEGAGSGQDDDRILDIKAQGNPSPWAYVAPAAVSQTNAASGGDNAYRTVLAYKALGYRVDDHLGWMTLADKKAYSVRERSPWKDTFDTTELTSITRFTNLAEQWGALLATHHARADKDWDSSVIAHSIDGAVHAFTDGDHAGFRALVRDLAGGYADQVELDYESFCASF
jgi:uncharacterized protein (DUF2252 family)